MRESLDFYLAQPYRFVVEPDGEDGGYVISYPDLPGCITQVEESSEIGPMAEEIRELWLESAWEDRSLEIPLPPPTDFSGKFVVRLPRSLHRSLVEAAEREGVSLNAYVAGVLARGDVQRRVERRLDGIEAGMARPDQADAAAAVDAA